MTTGWTNSVKPQQFCELYQAIFLVSLWLHHEIWQVFLFMSSPTMLHIQPVGMRVVASLMLRSEPEAMKSHGLILLGFFCAWWCSFICLWTWHYGRVLVAWRISLSANVLCEPVTADEVSSWLAGGRNGCQGGYPLLVHQCWWNCIFNSPNFVSVFMYILWTQ